jgi:predicted lipoprotein with Yx(FWY)xxD motif
VLGISAVAKGELSWQLTSKGIVRALRMIYSNTKASLFVKATVAIAFTSALAVAPLALAADEASKDTSGTKEITGEVVDMMCYVDHGAKGDKHAGCAEKCIKNGGPVGILSDGKAILVVGDHKPMNDELAPLAGKTVTLKGKMASNGGVNMLENAEIVKK